MREVARAAALEGGRVILEAAGSGPAEAKGLPGDWVTEVDLAAERAIGGLLAGATPDIPVVGEELGGERAERYWLVDPLDGTTNFVHGLPVVAVSVALMEGTRPVAGCVHAPFLRTTFTAARGEGAEQDGREIRVSSRPPEAAVVATGFPFRRKERLPEYRRVFDRALAEFEDLRRAGTASLDLAWTAAGVFDGFFELGLGPWDVAAGALLVEEAGGLVTDWAGGDGWLDGDVLCGPPQIHERLRSFAG